MAIPQITNSGYSRTVDVHVVRQLEVSPPQIFVERTYVLAGEEFILKWKPSKYYPRVTAVVAKDSDFVSALKTVTCENSAGTSLGVFPPGTYYVRAEWDASSLVKPKE
jgi:hypothetical protein